MKIPEYEYDQMCVPNLDNCPWKCHCYHSWELGDVVVANCSYHKEYFTNFPSELPKGTSYLILSHNNIENLCHSLPYFTHLKTPDLSWNKINSTCPGEYHELTSLVHRELTRNRLLSLPQDITEMANLHPGINQLKELPKSIENMTELDVIVTHSG